MQIPEPPVLIFIGTTARAAAESAVAEGFRTCAIDLFGDRDLLSICEQWLPLGNAAEIPYQLSRLPPAPVIFLGGLGITSEVVGQISRLRPVLGATAEMLLQIRDPQWIDRLAAESAIGRPERRRSIPPDPGNWLFKKTDSTGGLGVFPASVVKQADPAAGCWERQITGRSFGISFLALEDRVDLIGAAAGFRSRRAAKPFQYEGSIGPIPLPTAMTQRLQTLAEQIARQTGLLGLFGVDVMIDAQQRLWLLEINPRWTASMELHQADSASLMRRHVDACLRKQVPTGKPTEIVTGKRVLYARETIRFRLETFSSSLPPQCRIADIPAERTEIPAGGPICTLLVRGTGAVAVARQLANGYRSIEFQNGK